MTLLLVMMRSKRTRPILLQRGHAVWNAISSLSVLSVGQRCRWPGSEFFCASDGFTVIRDDEAQRVEITTEMVDRLLKQIEGVGNGRRESVAGRLFRL